MLFHAPFYFRFCRRRDAAALLMPAQRLPFHIYLAARYFRRRHTRAFSFH
jgi:hypothetical protein